MNFNDYQKQALKSVAITDKSALALAHRSLGLAGEAGIAGNAMKKVIRDKNGKPSKDDVKLLREKLGDVLYYVAVLAEYVNLELEDVAQDNLAKSLKFKQQRNKK